MRVVVAVVIIDLVFFVPFRLWFPSSFCVFGLLDFLLLLLIVITIKMFYTVVYLACVTVAGGR